jgi:hypothetical protein
LRGPAVAQDGRLVFSEEFYAAAQKSDMERRKTRGHLKELVNSAIARRIATVRGAAAGMPENLRSAGGLGLFTRKGNVDWTEGAPTEAHDWDAWLTQR